MNKYQNLWADETRVKRPEFYENDYKVVHEYKGVQVIKKWDQAFDFVLNGTCIAQRAGISEYKTTIDDLLEGRSYCSDKVAAHINAQGFKALPYPD